MARADGSRVSRRRLLGSGAALTAWSTASAAARGAAPAPLEVDVCVYGATVAGIMAAIQAQRMGVRVVLLEPSRRIGGMTASGLGLTDIGNREAIGGLAREFYARVRGEYAREYGEDSPQLRDCRDGFRFEPRVAERVLRRLLEENSVRVLLGHRVQAARRRGTELRELLAGASTTVRARVFVDATPEGDLLPLAGVSYTVGRESNATYRETLNGVQFGRPFHQFRVPVDPYRVEGQPGSGLLPGISDEDPGRQGEGDHRVQAYNFRLCLTDVAANRMPYPRPAGYRAERYELLLRYIRAGVWDAFRPVDRLPNGKVDLNNNGAFSTDHIGGSYAWPEGDPATRARIYQDHVQYQQGLLWFLASDERLPERVRADMARWGLARDEFRETGGWPHHLYVREGRRLVSDLVVTEHHCLGSVPAEDPVGMGAYAMDSHHVQRVEREGRVENEGDVQVAGFPPYGIPYRALTPRESECSNLLVPVCLSASHIAYGSIRMEPVYMVLGQSAGAAAALAVRERAPVQRLAYRSLRARLEEARQVLGGLRIAGPTALVLEPGSLPGVVVDDPAAEKRGAWSTSLLPNLRRVGSGYLHDDDSAKGLLSITFTPDLPTEGAYDVVVIFPPNPGAATNVPVSLRVEGLGTQAFRVNQRATEQNGFVSLGTFKLPSGRRTSVTIANEGTDGTVIADAVQFLPR